MFVKKVDILSEYWNVSVEHGEENRRRNWKRSADLKKMKIGDAAL